MDKEIEYAAYMPYTSAEDMDFLWLYIKHGTRYDWHAAIRDILLVIKKSKQGDQQMGVNIPPHPRKV